MDSDRPNRLTGCYRTTSHWNLYPRTPPGQHHLSLSLNRCPLSDSVQNGQFLSRLAQNASDLLVASHTDKAIEHFLVYVVATALAIDQTPTLQSDRACV